MKLFSNRVKGNYHIIVGCGRLGANLANTLSDGDTSVLVIDKDTDSFRKLSPAFTGQIMEGDATEYHVLVEAGIKEATAVVSVTNNDNTNILVAQIARELFNVPHVIARLYDPERECVYHEFGIDTICPAVLSAKEIDRFLHMPATEGNAV